MANEPSKPAVPPTKPVVASPPVPAPVVPRRDTAVAPSTKPAPTPPPLTPDRRGRYSELRLFIAELDAAIAAHDGGAIEAAVAKFKSTSNLLAAEIQRDKREAERRRR